jgi:PTS system nitrogen regulatory IIA component
MTEWTAGEFTFPLVEIPPSAAVSRDEAVRFLVWSLVVSGQLQPGDATTVVEWVLKRESWGSTALGGGVAIPHALCSNVERLVGLVGRSAEGILWSSADELVREVCLLVVPVSRPGDHFRALQAVSARLRNL